MKKTLLLSMSILFAFCGSVKRTLKEVDPNEVGNFELLAPCPIDGDCKVTRLKNTSLEVKKSKDEGSFGQLYYELVENEGYEVIIYTYERAYDDIVVDGFYKEEIIFEIPAVSQRFILDNRGIQEVQMLFGRFCYCKGQNGYYKVKEGKLDVKRSDKKVKATLDFKITEVPQVLEHISFTVK